MNFRVAVLAPRIGSQATVECTRKVSLTNYTIIANNLGQWTQSVAFYTQDLHVVGGATDSTDSAMTERSLSTASLARLVANSCICLRGIYATYFSLLVCLGTAIIHHMLRVPKGIRSHDQHVVQVLREAGGQVANVGPGYAHRAPLGVQNDQEPVGLGLRTASRGVGDRTTKRLHLELQLHGGDFAITVRRLECN